MELHQLRYVVAVARSGNFTRAAEELFLAQPSLSVQVRKLEHELGVQLFERLGRTVKLTHAGEVFLEHAERALFEIATARERLADVRELRRGRLALGTLPSVGAHLLPGVLAAFRRAHPGVVTSLVELDVSAEVERRVHAGELDLAVIRLPRSREGLTDQLLVRERLVAVLPPDSALAGASQLALKDLADQDFVAMRPGHGLRELMTGVCADAGVVPRVTVETGQLSIVLGMVRAGVGVAVLPRLAAGEGATVVPLSDPSAYRELGVVWRAYQPVSPAAAAFLDLLRRSVATGRCGIPGDEIPCDEPPAAEPAAGTAPAGGTPTAVGRS